MQIMMNETVGPFKKGQFFKPLRIGFFNPEDPERLSATLLYDNLFYVLDAEQFDIKIRKVSKK